MKKFFASFGGVLLAALYGLMLRFLFDARHNIGFIYDLFGITFLGVVPVILGVIPMLFTSMEQLKSVWYVIVRPVLVVLVFSVCCLSVGIEDLICIIIGFLPYFGLAILGSAIARSVIINYRKKKGILYSVLLLPLILGPIEVQFDAPAKTYSVDNRIIVNAKPELVWQNIIRVPEIKEEEYHKGFFNYAGIPRPLYAELDKDTLNATRVGHFEGGLKFVERVIEWEEYKHIGFDITVVPSSIRRTVFDQHVLNGNRFRFLNAAYTLNALPNGKTELILSSTYELKTRVNAYGSFWGEQMLSDFQERLLQVIKTRCE